MQRAAASTSPATPDSGSQSSKKRKLDHSSKEGRLSMNMDQAAIQAAINEQQATRQAALDRHVTGDTHWVLKSTLDGADSKKKEEPPLRIKYIGYGDVDSGDESGDPEDEAQTGRTSTNNYKKTASKVRHCPETHSWHSLLTFEQKQKTSASETNGNESAGSDSEDSDSEASPAGRSQRPQDSKSSSRNGSRSRSRSIQRSESVKAKELRDKRRKKDVPLSKVTSISSGGNKNFSPSSGKPSPRGGRKN